MQDDDGLGGGILEILNHAVKVEPAGILKGGKENTVIFLQYKTELQQEWNAIRDLRRQRFKEILKNDLIR